MKDAETGQRGYLLTGKNEFLEPYNGAYAKTLIEATKVADLTADNPRQQKNIKVVKQILLQRMTILKELIDKKRSGRAVTIEDLQTGKASMDALRAEIKIMEQEEQRLLVIRSGRLSQSTSFVPLVVVASAVIALIISIFYYVKILSDIRQRNRLESELLKKGEETTHRLDAIKEIADQIAQGRYHVRVSDLDKGSLGPLANSLNRMAETLEQSFHKLNDDEWLQTGVAQFNNRLVGEKNTGEIANEALTYIADYTHSNTGALYTKKNENLDLGAAVRTGENVKSTVPIGHGIIGQVGKSGKPVLLSNLDPELIIVEKDLVNSIPNTIITLPIQDNGEVAGVIELTTVSEFTKRERNFMQEAAGRLGIALKTAEGRERLQELFEEVQAQSEELKAQHADLERTNIELEEQSNSLISSEEELRVQQEELFLANQQLEETNRIIDSKNSEIERRANELERSAKYKSEFMANMSHELRTPLNSILLLSRYLSDNIDKNMTGEQLEAANIINGSGKNLLDLIDELLDLSKIEAGKMDLELENVIVKAIENDLRQMFTPIAGQKNLQFEILNKLGDHFEMETDKMRLEQILRNLLSNAFKFTEHGSVKLNILPRENGIAFSIIDTGPGIAQDKHDLIFEAFRQADGSTKRKYGGTGLGLAISRQLAKLLRGEIIIDSQPGNGSTFTLLLPLA